jgi:outer membrane protein TolC
VLTADTQFYRAQIGQLQALAQRYQDTTALFIALGGGWQSAPAHAVSGVEPKEGRE